MERKIIQTTNRKYGAESLRSWYSLRWSRNSPSFMKLRGWTLYSKEVATGLRPESMEFSPQFHTLFLWS